ncbi:MAG: UDP-N-acetylmuramoyl-L-alanine--D-glutamate ligase [Bacilli bacterium]|nr:UDP-N-acetylmuramoyl-L-alanine--D-glutamate ligase [Bacilli bacterium]
MINEIIKELDGKQKVLILGFGREGKSTYQLIRKYLKDKPLTIADGNENLISNNKELLEDKNVKLLLGKNYLSNLDSFDCVIKSPGVNFKYVNHDKIKERITSQIDLFFRHANCLTIGVTGTKGKSTTASLIYHVLKDAGKMVKLVGNIGVPVFNEIEDVKKDTIVVTELSCHQLQFVKASPNVSVLLNIYEEHLDLYKSYDEYQMAKLNIFKYQKPGDYKVWGIDSRDSYKWFKKTDNTYAFTMEDKPITRGITIKKDGLYLVNGDDKKLVYERNRKRNLLGEHNLYNVAAAMCVCEILNLDLKLAADSIDTFKPLEHRMEYVGKFKQIDFYNDSIATIPSATINCIKSIPNAQTLIVGGMDRGVDLSSLVSYLSSADNVIKTCLCLRDTGYKIADELELLKSEIRLIKVSSMEEAVKKAYEVTEPGCACILSPAAASYNTYKNFEERGLDYKKMIAKYS